MKTRNAFLGLLTVFILTMGAFWQPSVSSVVAAPADPTSISCINFGEFAPGTPVEGLGTVHPDLNIQSSGNVVAIHEDSQPGMYGSLVGGNGNLGLLQGFADITKAFHDYSFTFSADNTVSFFSLRMTDFGDLNILRATEHEVRLVAFNAAGDVVVQDVLSFTSDGLVNPRSGSAGNLRITGDAGAALGEPGNYEFVVAGSDITRLEVQYFTENGVGISDPNHALSNLCFDLDVDITPPSTDLSCANFNQIAVGESVEGPGTVHPYLTIASTGNAVAMYEGVAPSAYGTPLGLNYRMGILNGFSDVEKLHEYTFTFSPNIFVDYFSLRMLDFGDLNLAKAAEHSITMNAYDLNGDLVDTQTLAYVSERRFNPTVSTFGDLSIYGDATADVGNPGNFVFEVAGDGISQVELVYENDVTNGASDPNHGLASLCFDPIIPEPPNNTCVDFNTVPAGESVEGMGTIHPQLNITSSTGNAVALVDGGPPGAYGSSLGGNYGMGTLGGFADADKIHDYTFTFAPNVSVDHFSMRMLDFGDLNIPMATEHEITLSAYDADGNLLDTSSLAYVSEARFNPKTSSYGDLSFTGDASTTLGNPGNYMFTVEGEGIVRLELDYYGDQVQQATDPNHGLAILCFQPETPEEPQLDPPTAALHLIRPKIQSPGGQYQVEYACSESAPNLVSAQINGYDVVNEQLVALIVDEDESTRWRDGLLYILFAPEFEMVVTCADDLGNETSESVTPVIEWPVE